MVKVVKRSGKEEEYLDEKVYKALLDAGASDEVAREIVKELDEWLKSGGRGKISTDEIRRFVLTRLRRLEPEVADAWQFYDRVFKGRITFEDGKAVVVEKGRLYLGRKVKDVGSKGLSTAEEVKEILDELREDMEYGLSPKVVNARLYALFMGVLKKKDMPPEEKRKAVELINKFREELGWKPYELKRPI
ncbi:ATP-cone domain protein [Thermoproteus uzoniensis 768-20]|uniref:ATP-cone domain protein n=1 Tax=Thermoproteus uzoniensis (strain 768-20) TaxID=999630 RepID=F2L1J8_THEU7|nr:ATP-binding protein [Thermoproteus uzoniensis]AEA11668.1 ATP-cone domain protein [Thermoproteus uzoniensis 768-20]